MKIGMRKPTLSKSLGLSFQGQLTRGLWRSLDQSYGKKHMGAIKHPQKALYNDIYSESTFGGFSEKDGTVGSIIRCLYKVGILK